MGLYKNTTHIFVTNKFAFLHFSKKKLNFLQAALVLFNINYL